METPARITKIEYQKKNKKRVSIFLDDEYAFGLDAAIVTQFCLKEGDALSNEQIKHILFNEEKQRVKEKAFRFLAGRAHSEKELRIKLDQKGYEKRITDQVITELKAQNLIDDKTFARSFANSRLINRPIGEHLMRSELRHKGVNEEIIEETIRTAYAEKSQFDLARSLGNKKKSHMQNLDPWKMKKRMSDFLIRRGFDWELVKEVIEEIFDS